MSIGPLPTFFVRHANLICLKSLFIPAAQSMTHTRIFTIPFDLCDCPFLSFLFPFYIFLRGLSSFTQSAVARTCPVTYWIAPKKKTKNWLSSEGWEKWRFTDLVCFTKGGNTPSSMQLEDLDLSLLVFSLLSCIVRQFESLFLVSFTSLWHGQRAIPCWGGMRQRSQVAQHKGTGCWQSSRLGARAH